MHFLQIQSQNFQNNQFQKEPIPISLMSKVFMAIYKKFPTTDTISAQYLLILDDGVSLQSPTSDKIHSFALSKKQNLVVVDFNQPIILSHNGQEKLFVGNSFELVSYQAGKQPPFTPPPQDINNQEEKALDWLKTKSRGNSEKSIIFHTFPKIAEYISQNNLDNVAFNHPYDTADFSRCMKVIKELNLNEEQFAAIANISKEWNNLILNFHTISNHIENGENENAYNLIKICINNNLRKKP